MTKAYLTHMVFDFRISGCYFDSGNSLPRGVMNLEKCVHGVPLAASFPHFLHADPELRQSVRGVTPPDPARHSMYMAVEQDLGALLATKIRLQVNLVITKDPAFPPLANIRPERLVLPLFWAEEGYDQLPPETMQFVDMILSLPSTLTFGLTVTLLIVGTVCMSVPMVKFWWRTTHKTNRNGSHQSSGAEGLQSTVESDELLVKRTMCSEQCQDDRLL